MAVATSTHGRLFELKTGHLREWFSRFEAVVVGDDPRLKHGKPAPDIFLLAASDLKAEPRDCLVFEDSPAGLQAAHAAGMQVVAAPYPGMDAERLRGAELLVGSLTEVKPEDLEI
jgi:pseudouridine-5'-monophosphatase